MENQTQETSLGSVKTYVTGFVLSLILTLTAYFLVQRHVGSHHAAISHNTLLFMLAGLAITQLLVQLIFFLHLDTESKPRWNLTVLLFAALVVLIVVAGSIWIMNNLNYHMQTPDQINKYMRSQSDL